MRTKLSFIFSILICCLPAFGVESSNVTPDIIFPKPGTDCILSGLSDNGKWAVYGSSIVDVTGDPFTFTEIGGSCRDISDDGKTVVGSRNGQPAVWKAGSGWHTLPTPAGSRGGTARKVTPDGRFAVGTVNLGVVNSSDGCMWNLEDLSIIELTGRPRDDRSTNTDDPNPYQNQYDDISADGRYVLGTLSYSYVGYQVAYVYDRQTDETRYIGYDRDSQGNYTPKEKWIHYTECEGISNDGHYVTGPVYLTKEGEYIAAYRYDVFTDTLEYFDEGQQADAWGFSVNNDGLVFLRKTAYSPYSDGYVCYNGFFYSFHDILTIGYGIDLSRYNIDNTGVPVYCSADGREIVFINSPQSSYFVRFKEDLRDVCDRLDILAKWTCTPAAGSIMSRISSLKVNFNYKIEADPADYKKIELLDSDGNLIANALQGGGLYASGSSLHVAFRTRPLEAGKEYFVRIPAGIARVQELPSKSNGEIIIKYVGREEGPVGLEKVSPASGSSLASLDLQENPVLLRFDSSLQLNSSAGQPVRLFIDDNPEPIATLLASLYDDRTVALFPAAKINLYTGSEYRISVPASLVTDLSGYGGSEALEILYTGNFVPTLGDEKYLFRSTCDNWDNFLFYEGDHGEPVAEYAEMGFTADTTPWWVVRESAVSTDMAFASHSCYTDGRPSDDWVVTRQLYLPDDSAVLEFDGQSYRRNKQDILRVYVYAAEEMFNSLRASDVEAMREKGTLVFEERLLPGATEDGLDNEWTHYAVSLADYAGKKIYIAFVNENCNQSLVIVDNITVSRNVNAFVTLTSPLNVVDREFGEVKGFLTVDNPVAEYRSLEMRLLDGDGQEISSINESGLSLSAGDMYAFSFAEGLPLKWGEENPFTIEFTLDNETDTYNSAIRNLTFKPVKRVVLEEFTGRDCQFCPQGHVMIERLTDLFPTSFIPVGLYCYNATDPKGLGVMEYCQYLGLMAAPSARINRRPASMPMYYSANTGRYLYSSTQMSPGEEGGSPLWYDETVAELETPAFIDVDVRPVASDVASTLEYSVEVKSAISLEGQNLRVFGVLLENGLRDYQVNAFYETEDAALGEWGKGGSLGFESVRTEFNHVARATWGQSYNGTGSLLPATLRPGEIYNVAVSMPVPSNVADVANCDFVVMVIDGTTGLVVNSASTAIDGASQPGDASVAAVGEAAGVSVSCSGGVVVVDSADEAEVTVYSVAGVPLLKAEGQGRMTLPIPDYKGMAVVYVRTAGGVAVRRILL